MARFAVINGESAISGEVENVIEAPPGFTIPGKTLIQSAVASRGFSLSGGNFDPPEPLPPPPPPPVITASPDGTKWKITVDDDGKITTKEIE